MKAQTRINNLRIALSQAFNALDDINVCGTNTCKSCHKASRDAKADVEDALREDHHEAEVDRFNDKKG